MHKSFEEVTIADIISGTRHSRSAFYHHFAGKFDVLVALADVVLAESYGGPQLWDTTPGRDRSYGMQASITPTLEMWSSHGGVIGAVVEHMHSNPDIEAVWRPTFDRFVAGVAEQIRHERDSGRAPDGARPEMIATVLVCGIERVMYVCTRELDPHLPALASAVGAVDWLTRSVLRPVPNSVPAPSAGTLSSATQARPHGDGPGGAHTQIEHYGVDPRSDTTSTAILDSLRDLLLDLPLDKVSVARIVRRAGVSRSTFYFYFDNKNAVFAELYREVAASTVHRLQSLDTIDRADRAAVGTVLREWLRIDARTTSVMRSALLEWPRRPELREVYRAGIAQMADYLGRVITADRRSGIAIPGPPPGELSAVVLWTIERSIAGALAGDDNLTDLHEVTHFLTELLTTAIYGSP
ncbi:TetR/AcrR family transcriptional regulator [Gordonia terrae]